MNERAHLLMPNVKFQTLDLRDRKAEERFFEALREAGVPLA